MTTSMIKDFWRCFYDRFTTASLKKKNTRQINSTDLHQTQVKQNIHAIVFAVFALLSARVKLTCPPREMRERD